MRTKGPNKQQPLSLRSKLPLSLFPVRSASAFSVRCVPCVLARRELRKPSADAAAGEEAVEVQKKNVGLVDKK